MEIAGLCLPLKPQKERIFKKRKLIHLSGKEAVSISYGNRSI
jgi:hypothetical protein